MAGSSAIRTPRPSGLADVLDLVLDKGIVIDAYVRLAVVGIEILTIDARIVIASVDTYLRFAEAVNRLDMEPQQEPMGLPTMMGKAEEGAAKQVTKRKVSGLADTAKDIAKSVRGDHEHERDAEAK